MLPIIRLDRTVVALATAIVLAAGRVVSAADAPQPTVAELLQRIEALEKALGEVRRDAQRCGEGADAAPPSQGPAVTAVPRATAPANASVPEPAASGAGQDRTAQAAAIEPAAPASAGTAPASTVEAKASAAAASAASPTAGYKDGFFLSSSDGAYALKVGGYLQFDSRFFTDNGPPDNVDQFTLRRARIDLRGTLARRFSFRLTPDFAGGQASLTDAYIDTSFAPWLMLRAGKFKTPFGLERLQSSTELLFVERALNENLTPGRDIGAQLSGDVAAGRLVYAAAVLNGVPDGTSGDGDVNDAVDIAARVFARPYFGNMYSPLRGAGFGVAATWGREQGSSSSPQLPSFRTSGRSKFFRYNSDSIADGDHWRVSPQAAWYEGPFSALAEYVMSSQQVANPDERAWLDNEAWQVRASWLMTGEKAAYAGAVVPDAPFDFGGGHWGAWEAAVRWSSLDVDGDAFSRHLADPDESARRADAIAAAINWYLNRNVRVMFNYEHTGFDGGAGAADDDGDRDDENVFLTRMQLVF